jgi:flavin reductase (DIM6/NTAB) family NADH-FMN oxidoreductase RutF/GTP cyclohydrolase II
MGHFATGVAVVTARAADGRPFGVTVNSLTSVSLDPPLLLVCLGHGSETLGALRATGRFGVSLLAADQGDLSARFARPARADTWDGVPVHHAARLPLLGGTLARLSCDVHELVDAGDHAVVIGAVRAADYSDPPPAPLLYFRGARAELVEPRPPEPGPPPATEAQLPSSLGRLRVRSLSADDRGRVSVAVSVGEPRGSRGALVYLHRGCVLGDAIGSTLCAGRARLAHAVGLMTDDGPGVVVYHRRDDGTAGCCLAAEPRSESLAADEASAVHRAVRALDLRAIRLLGDQRQASALADAGVPVASVISPDPRT